MGNLTELNQLSSVGWRVVGLVPELARHYHYWALLEREVVPLSPAAEEFLKKALEAAKKYTNSTGPGA